MLKPRSLQHEYSLIYSEDCALKLPTGETERETALRVARQTGKWSELTLQGETPTVFQVLPMTGTQFSYLGSEQVRKGLLQMEVYELAIRLVLRSIANFGDHKVTHSIVEGHQIAGRATIDALYAIGETPAMGRAVIAELGEIIISHASDGISPLA